MLIPSSRRAAALAVLVSVAAPAARACDTVPAFLFDLTGGHVEWEVNGVPTTRFDAPANGSVSFVGKDFLQDGENEIAVVLSGEDASLDATFHEGCVGSFDYGPPLSEISMQGPGRKTVTWTGTVPGPAPAWTRAEPSDEAGLMEAVAALQSAVEAGDAATVIALHDPMFSDARAQGMPEEQIKGMMGFILGQPDPALPQDLTTRSALDGRVHIVTTPDDEPPVTIVVKQPDGTLTWATGAYWGKVDGEWGVLSLW